MEDEKEQSVSTDRLCVEPLKLSEPHTVVEGGDGSTVLKFQTPRGIHSAYELVLRNHFDDLLKYLQTHEPMKFDDKNIGRIIQFKSHKDVIGVVCGVTADRKEYHIGTADESMRGQYTRDAFIVPRAQPATQSSQGFQFTDQSTQHKETKAQRYQRQRERRFRVLEICCGKHKSLSTQFRKMYPKAEVVTVDVKAKCSPDICEDIRHWDVLSMYPQSYFDIVWVSTPCKEYSPAKTTAPRNLKEADSIALAALRILKQLQPEVWFWENPNTMLQKRTFMQHLKALSNFTSYCKYRCKFEKIQSSGPTSSSTCNQCVQLITPASIVNMMVNIRILHKVVQLPLVLQVSLHFKQSIFQHHFVSLSWIKRCGLSNCILNPKFGFLDSLRDRKIREHTQLGCYTLIRGGVM